MELCVDLDVVVETIIMARSGSVAVKKEGCMVRIVSSTKLFFAASRYFYPAVDIKVRILEEGGRRKDEKYN